MLAFTDGLSQHNEVSDAVYVELARHFSEREILKLSFTVGLAGMVNRVHATFRTDVDDATVEAAGETPFCVLPRD